MSETEERALEGGAYEVIRSRLETHGRSLREGIVALNEKRQDVFGSVETALAGTERITTKNKCIPRDMVSLGENRLLFGYNVHFGLRSHTNVSDVFALYEYHPEEHHFQELPLNDFFPADFQQEFEHLYRYYRETIFAKFLVKGPHLYMAFRSGKSVEDVKTFKWTLEEGGLVYEGNRFDHEYRFPETQEFTWKRAHRDMFRFGEHPHISIEDRIFVETVGGDLTIKIEDNTADGRGIYEEAVSEVDQTLDDAEVYYAIVGSLILLKILPYREKDYRFLVYNEKVQTVMSVPAIRDSCVLLPEDQGLIFPSGYLLQVGEVKLFDLDRESMIFERRISSANGEDTLFVFYNRASGEYVLLSYNIITQTVETPTLCHGFSLFENGELILFRTEEEAQKHHALQIWSTPFLSIEQEAVQAKDQSSYLYKVGNAELVRCMSESQEILTLLGKDDQYADLYLDLSKRSGDILDSYFWLGREEAGGLREALLGVREAAQAAISEFEKVQRMRRSATEALAGAGERVARTLAEVRHAEPKEVPGFVELLGQLRQLLGDLIALQDVRYLDTEKAKALQDEVETAAGHVSERCVDFLDQEEALSVYQQRIVQSREAIPAAAKVLEVREIEGELNDSGSALDLLLDTVSNLQIEDTTKSTRILDHISALYAELNQTRGAAKARRGELAQKEGAAEFHAQTRLLEQAAANYLDLSVSAEKCEEYLTKVMIQLEELEGRFGDFGEYIDVLGQKRDELYEAFEAKKVQLTEARNRRAESLRRSGERILTGIRHRVAQFETDAEIHGYLAGDLMVQKVRQSIESLRDLGDSVRADDLRTQLQSVGQEALRQLQDRSDLFSADGQTIAFGEHRFSVNHQELELTLVPRDDQMFFHITGTNFFEPVGDVAFGELRGYWDQTLPSETDEVYRAEYLAHSYWKRQGEMSLESLQGDLVTRYGEGYTKGIHDEDAWQIVQALQETHDSLGVLRFDPATRALAILFWIAWEDAEEKGRWTARWKAKGLRERAFGEGGEPFFADGLIEQVGRVRDLSGLQEADVLGSLIYLAKERAEGEGFRISRAAFDCVGHFRRMLTAKRVEPGFEEGMDALAGHPIAQFRLAQEWLRGAEVAEDGEVSWEGIEEAAAHLLREDLQRTDVVDGEGTRALEGMKGEHRRIQMGGHYAFSYHDVCRRVALHEEVVVPDYERWQDLKAKQLEGRRRELRLDEFHPEVMRAFVRNRLIDEVYLPVIGANLAKQLGTAGAESRADRMGLLLLISPPGYGKTTLMEYVAARLGITFVKVNGPAVGHAVTSLDPGEAPNASAREEVEKLNLALEMGDNVMIYLDDIQHCHPEFLQKFISLCDAQRKMEGVWNGEARTYDLRGKKVAVVMAGNPYTESGGKFQVPDMLANRADTYNLGDILGGHEEAFRVSYLENALTSNAVLSKIAARHHRDIDGFLKMVESGSEEGVELQANYSVDEMEEIRQVLSKLLRVRDTVLRVNQGYIASAAQADAYRVEPPFKLQGSYRNMNRLAAQIEPLMTDAEVEQALVDHYRNESQNLTTGAEANLLKFREMEGLLSPEESERWEGIREQFQKNQVMQGGGDDPVGRIVGQLALFESGLQELRTSIETVGSREGRPVSNGSEEDQWRRLEGLMEKMQRLPVDIHLRLEGGGHGGADSFVPPAVWKVDERIRHFVDDVFLPRSEPQKEISVPDRAQVEREWQQMETSYEVKLPRLFREWFSYKSLARTDFAIARLPAVSSEDPLGEWRELLRQLEEKEWFREQGLVPFAWAGNGVGPLCFDTKESRAGKDYPVRLCEEERLSEEEYRGEPFAEDFAALLRLIEEDLLAFGDSG